MRWSATNQGLSCITTTPFSPDEPYLLTIADGYGDVQLGDTQNEKRLQTCRAPQYGLPAATFTSDNQRFLLSCLPDKIYTGFDRRTGCT